VLHGSIVAFVVYRMIARGPAERSPAPPVAPP
jgi:hypothetical protein